MKDMLHLQVVFAMRPHARILSITTDAARRYPGVVAVLTAEDVPYNRYGLIDDDQPVLCESEVRFEGDKVALVVAETQAAAREAAELVAVEYEDLTGGNGCRGGAGSRLTTGACWAGDQRAATHPDSQGRHGGGLRRRPGRHRR